MTKEKGLNICVFYLCVHKRLYEKVGLSGIITKKDLFRMLGESYHIPQVLKIIVVKEMVKMKMIEERINKQYYKILPLLIDPELNSNKFYEKLGLY